MAFGIWFMNQVTPSMVKKTINNSSLVLPPLKRADKASWTKMALFSASSSVCFIWDAAKFCQTSPLYFYCQIFYIDVPYIWLTFWNPLSHIFCHNKPCYNVGLGPWWRLATAGIQPESRELKEPIHLKVNRAFLSLPKLFKRFKSSESESWFGHISICFALNTQWPVTATITLSTNSIEQTLLNKWSIEQNQTA